MIAFLKRIFGWPDDVAPDPCKHCDYYKTHGCTHVDGFLCDVRTCSILKDYRNGRISK